MVSLSEVAKAAGVSKSVASRALSGDTAARIKPETAQRVKEVAQRLNYIPNHQARALRSSRTETIALIVPTVNNAVFGELFAGVQNRAQELNLQVLLGEIHNTESDIQRIENLIRRGLVDGAIVQKPEDMQDKLFQDFLIKKYPVVVFNSEIPKYSGAVLLPDKEGVQLAVKHLVELGHRKIAFIGGTELHDAAQRRKKAFHEAVTAVGIEVSPELIVDAGWEVEAGQNALRQLLESTTPPTAVVVASVNAALGALSSAVRTGVKVPEDLSIIAIHDIWFAQVATPPLTVVKMPLYEAGRIATDVLQEYFEDKLMKNHVVADPGPQLIVRGSTGLVAR